MIASKTNVIILGTETKLKPYVVSKLSFPFQWTAKWFYSFESIKFWKYAFLMSTIVHFQFKLICLHSLNLSAQIRVPRSHLNIVRLKFPVIKDGTHFYRTFHLTNINDNSCKTISFNNPIFFQFRAPFYKNIIYCCSCIYMQPFKLHACLKNLSSSTKWHYDLD